MNKIKHLLLFVCIAGCFAACKKDSTEDFDVEAQFKADTTAIRAYITTNKIPALKDASGVFYQVITPGEGTVSYLGTTKVTVAYKGRLLNGTVFDSSTSYGPAALNTLITGWGIGVSHIQKGGSIRLFIPSYFGYGHNAVGSIPSDSILDFDITLNDVQ